MGQHGLPVFCAGIFLSFLGRVALEQSEGWPVQAGGQPARLGAMVAIAAVGAWYRRRSGEGGRKRGPPRDRRGGGWNRLACGARTGQWQNEPAAALLPCCARPGAGCRRRRGAGADEPACGAPAELLEPGAPLPATARAVAAGALRIAGGRLGLRARPRHQRSRRRLAGAAGSAARRPLPRPQAGNRGARRAGPHRRRQHRHDPGGAAARPGAARALADRRGGGGAQPRPRRVRGDARHRARSASTPPAPTRC